MPYTDHRPQEATRIGDAAQTETVLPANWPEACAEFARRHHGRSVRVLTLSTSALTRGDITGVHEVAGHLPLDNVAPVAAVPLPNIDIRVCDAGVRTVQRIERPKTLAVEKVRDGRVLGLRIDDEDGVTTLVQVQPLPLPAMPDRDPAMRPCAQRRRAAPSLLSPGASQ